MRARAIRQGRFGRHLRRLAVALAACGALAWFFRPLPMARPWCPPDVKVALGRLTGEMRGVVVFQRESADQPESIWKTVVGRSRAYCISENGRYPRWSPDGRRVAFIRGNRIMVVSAGGRWPRVLAVAEDPNPRALMFHPGGGEVWFTDGNRIRAVTLWSRRIRTVIEGMAYRSLDVAPDGQRLVVATSGHRVFACDLGDGSVRRISTGCSPSLSPDGELIAHNTGGHKRLALRRWGDGTEAGKVTAPPGYTFDNVAWSNDPRWIASRTEQPGHQHVLAQDTRDDSAVQITFTGDVNRPDLFVRPGPYGWCARLSDWCMKVLRL